MNTFDEYTRAANRTIDGNQSEKERLLNAALGLAGEVGEVVEHIKKYCFHSKPLDAQKLAYEAGDVQWYLNLLAETINVSLRRIAEMNIHKLAIRHPEKFTPNYADVHTCSHGVVLSTDCQSCDDEGF